MHFWFASTAETVLFAATLPVAALFAWLLVWRFRIGVPDWPDTAILEFLVWERDRVLSIAKGTAVSATGFLTAVVVALLKQEIKAEVPGVAVLGCALGAVGLLLLAARMSAGTRVTAAVTFERTP